MIYLFITVTLSPTQDSWGPVDLYTRQGRYERCITATLNALNNLNQSLSAANNDLFQLNNSIIRPVILINDIGISESYLDVFKHTYDVDIVYTSNNRLDTKHKGICELDTINYAMNLYNVQDDDIVIKQTGRYCMCDENPTHFFSNVVTHINDYDCFIKFYNIATQEYDENDTTMGLYAMRVKYLKRFQFKHICVVSNPSPQSAERELAEYIHNYIPPEKIFKVDYLYMECSPANDPDYLVYV